jgi:hypothetical protein
MKQREITTYMYILLRIGYSFFLINAIHQYLHHEDEEGRWRSQARTSFTRTLTISFSLFFFLLSISIYLYILFLIEEYFSFLSVLKMTYWAFCLHFNFIYESRNMNINKECWCDELTKLNINLVLIITSRRYQVKLNIHI